MKTTSYEGRAAFNRFFAEESRKNPAAGIVKKDKKEEQSANKGVAFCFTYK